MSSLKTYDRTYSDKYPSTLPPTDYADPWPFIREGGIDILKPGDQVKHIKDGGQGIVIAVNDEQLTILWSVEPYSQDIFSNFVFPIMRRVNYPALAQQMVTVQPMKLPQGLIFHMDYQYPDVKLTERCNTGHWPVKMFWRSYRCLSSTFRKCWSKVKSFKNWSFGIRRIVKDIFAPPVVEDENTKKSRMKARQAELIRSVIQQQQAQTQLSVANPLSQKWQIPTSKTVTTSPSHQPSDPEDDES